ncbi:hypothetical protein CABS01_11301 [Colletotrichum abscissum]|uniref:Uncharacterized protein n=1 Tax=Colletotrichum lupini TaxID=145971 RepID=A0A9Q8SLF0_9PEZI|nr:uncharacterized protein CLUP02_04495 [Colletotrichum lupini]XP_060397904.1 uncharacterized protein CABS01_11301 [Colletotrichum abscissum]KAK1495073.1 hypothetical protein CABS01_11301 [Colletotrichum abscissum]UQC79016.1 hypothetical protein CLUP02_04495 [Colletotrichum lupini]
MSLAPAGWLQAGWRQEWSTGSADGRTRCWGSAGGDFLFWSGAGWQCFFSPFFGALFSFFGWGLGCFREFAIGAWRTPGISRRGPSKATPKLCPKIPIVGGTDIYRPRRRGSAKLLGDGIDVGGGRQGQGLAIPAAIGLSRTPYRVGPVAPWPGAWLGWNLHVEW